MTAIRPTSTVRVRPAAIPARPAAPARVPAAAPIARVSAAADGGGWLKAVGQGFAKFQWAVRWLINGPTVDQWKTREVLADPDTRFATRAELDQAKAQLGERAGAERAALATLGARAEGYNRLAERCAKDPMARLALQTMLLDGRLTGAKDLNNSGDLLSHLDRLATQPLVAGLDRDDLLTNLIEELENPTKIAQEYRGTCVATSATIMATRLRPAEYARLVSELAGPPGTAALANGDTLTRNATWNNADDGGRTPSVRLLQPALMDYGNFFLRYDNDRDVHTLDAGTRSIWERLKDGWDQVRRAIKLPGGLEGFGSNRILEALTGRNFTTIHNVTRLNRESAWRRIESALARGSSVPVGLVWEGGGHKVLLDKVEGGYAFYTNPWGQQERMTVAEFKGNLMDANIPSA